MAYGGRVTTPPLAVASSFWKGPRSGYLPRQRRQSRRIPIVLADHLEQIDRDDFAVVHDQAAAAAGEAGAGQRAEGYGGDRIAILDT